MSEFRQAVRAVRIASQAYWVAVNKNASRKECSERAREYWAKFEELARLYSSPDNWHNGSPMEIIPPDFVAWLGEIAGFLAAGRIPPRIKDCVHRTPRRVPPEMRRISLAVAYIKAAKKGDIKDPYPVNTVCKYYKSSRATVQAWVHDGAIKPAKCETDQLAERMKEAGAWHAQQGRNYAAIESRGRPV